MLIVVSVIRGCRTSGVAGTEVSCTLMIFYVVGHIYSAEVISSGWVIIMLLTFVGSCFGTLYSCCVGACLYGFGQLVFRLDDLVYVMIVYQMMMSDRVLLCS